EDAVIADGPDQLQPVRAHVGLAADERDLPRAEPRALADDVETLFGRQLVRPAVAGARAAVGALQIAGESNLPHYVHRPAVREVVVGAVALRESALHRATSWLRRSSSSRRPALWPASSARSRRL